MYRPPPEYPRASSSPTIIMLVAGLTGVLGFLIGFLTGLGSGELAAGPAPRVTVTVEEPPPDLGPSDPVPTDLGVSASPSPFSSPSAPTPGTSDPAASDLADHFPSIQTLVVGVDIQPGTYRTTGPAAGSPQCYWARMNTDDGGLGGVIDAGMLTGPATVTILASDKSFQTAGCAEWTRA